MFGSKTTVLSLIILCSIQLQYGNGAVRESRDSQRFGRGCFYLVKNSFDDGNLVFAVYEAQTKSRIICNVVHKVYRDKQVTRTCNITIKGDQDDSELSSYVGVDILGEDKAIIHWDEEYNNSTTTKIGTVDLKNCKMNQVAIRDPKRKIRFDLMFSDTKVKYNDDSFDIFFNDPRFGEKLGKLEFNSDGTAKSELIATNIDAGVLWTRSIATRSSSKGYAYLRKNDTDYTLFIVKPDGTEKYLAVYSYFSEQSIVAASDNFVSACTTPTPFENGTCSQYDEDGNVKFTITTNNRTEPTAIHNLPGGGMLVMVADTRGPYGVETNYRMVKIAADGKVMGTVRTEEFDRVATLFDKHTNQFKETYVYMCSESEYCAVLVEAITTDNEPEPSDYQVIRHCVTDDEFSV